MCFISPELGTKKYGSTEHVEERREAGEGEGEERQKWGSPVEFLLSCIAMSVRFNLIISVSSHKCFQLLKVHCTHSCLLYNLTLT